MSNTEKFVLDSSIGKLLVSVSEGFLEEIIFPAGLSQADVESAADFPQSKVGKQTAKQLTEYFDGKRKVFDLPLKPKGTPFQLSVWDQLLAIPYGEIDSYGEVAKRIGNPKGSRAVGAANGKNPIPIVIPCHRVVGKDGKLTGFGGGIETKVKLLQLEKSFTSSVNLEITAGTKIH